MRIHHHLFALIASALCTQTILAGVTITGTRIVFPSNQNTVTVQLNNAADKPALVQAWLDDGDENDIPDADKIPFILTPPLTKVEANKGQMLRIISKGTEQLAKDRESLFWFNILDIPSSELKDSELEETNKLQVSIRSRIKLFYRPHQLKISPDKAMNNVQFAYSKSAQTIHIKNPSPYYMSFWDLTINPEKEKIEYTENLMIAPFSTEKIKLSNPTIPTQVKYNLINDFGANQIFKATIESIE
ncbi:fimbrial chaperone protein [Acinetobacter calcoaceticus]|uniref:Fimbrial chaperone protein n=1 Tax=Acinetobacter calcoaceticus TaxID=471 RepID=A0A4R1Y0I4_ACICA|nr:fimbrial chaperone protein [Acinetobacter calcoaceticus]